MGYACPVCETPQRDAEHLANHLAFTAMLHGDEHETWLDDRVPGWADAGVAELAAVVTDHAPEAAYDEVFEDAVPEQGRGHGRDAYGDDNHHDHDHGRSTPPGGVADVPNAPDAETRQVLAEARELTREMLGEADADADGGEEGDEKA
jgi:hypothetical protein